MIHFPILYQIPHNLILKSWKIKWNTLGSCDFASDDTEDTLPAPLENITASPAPLEIDAVIKLLSRLLFDVESILPAPLEIIAALPAPLEIYAIIKLLSRLLFDVEGILLKACGGSRCGVVSVY